MILAVRAAPKSGFLGVRLGCGDIHALKRCFILTVSLSLVLSTTCVSIRDFLSIHVFSPFNSSLLSSVAEIEAHGRIEVRTCGSVAHAASPAGFDCCAVEAREAAALDNAHCSGASVAVHRESQGHDALFAGCA